MRRYDRQSTRGLHTGSKAWRNIRESVLRQQPLCPYCEALGQIVPATEVDHRNNNSHDQSRDNLIGMCAQHHASKSAVEATGKAWRFKGVGPDGWSIGDEEIESILARYSEA